MSHNLQVFQTVLALAYPVLLCVLLKQRGLIAEEHGLFIKFPIIFLDIVTTPYYYP